VNNIKGTIVDGLGRQNLSLDIFDGNTEPKVLRGLSLLNNINNIYHIISFIHLHVCKGLTAFPLSHTYIRVCA
jgi:hypothetical protein